MGVATFEGTKYYDFNISVYLKSSLIRRGMGFGGRGLIRRGLLYIFLKRGNLIRIILFYFCFQILVVGDMFLGRSTASCVLFLCCLEFFSETAKVTETKLNFFLYHGCIVMVIKDSDCPFGKSHWSESIFTGRGPPDHC